MKYKLKKKKKGQCDSMSVILTIKTVDAQRVLSRRIWNALSTRLSCYNTDHSPRCRSQRSLALLFPISFIVFVSFELVFFLNKTKILFRGRQSSNT